MGTRARPLLLGLLLMGIALALVVAGVQLRGPLNPACAGRPYSPGCFDLGPTLLFVSALPVAIVGGILVAIWLGRRAAADEDQPR